MNEARSVLVAGEKHIDNDTDLFGAAMENFGRLEDSTYAVKFAAIEPLRMKTSARANLALGRMYVFNKHYLTALQFLQTSSRLDKKSTAPYILMALVHRKQYRWTVALRAAEQAVALDEKDGEAHYERACALARLGRTKEAMSALEKAIELYPDQAEWMGDETDLKALASLPAFKKLLPEPVKQ